MTNLDIAKLLRQVAAAYTIEGENRFKIIAYENAATAIEHATSELKDLWDDGKLDSVPGLGPSIISHLDEIFRTGKSKHISDVLSKINPAIFDLLEIPGIGPKKAAFLVKNLKISSVADLKIAAINHKIANLEGFGEKSERDILENIEKYQKGAIKEKRITLLEADRMADEVIDWLGVKVEKLGSLRRRVATIGDIDLAVATDEPEKIVKRFIDYPRKSSVIEIGPTGASILLTSGRQVDLRVSKPEEFGAMLQYFTGSKYHNIKLREHAIKKGMSLSEYGIKIINKAKSQIQSPKANFQFTNEQDFYNFLGLEFIPPELREDAGEIESAAKHTLPNLIELKDIKGDLQMHSNFDLETSHDSGLNTIEEMRKKGEKLGYEYIAITDHNPSVSKHTKEQINSSLTKRKRFIEQINSKTKNTRVINMLEIDILPNGELAVDPIDPCLVSIHSSFAMNRNDMTKRVLKALSYSKAKILAHPTGRLLGQREGYELNWDTILEFCKKFNKAVEINAYPNRLDLPDILVREAVKQGVLLSIGTDAHNVDGMEMMPFGVSVARRGWATKDNIINCWSYDKILSWLKS